MLDNTIKLRDELLFKLKQNEQEREKLLQELKKRIFVEIEDFDVDFELQKLKYELSNLQQERQKTEQELIGRLQEIELKIEHTK